MKEKNEVLVNLAKKVKVLRKIKGVTQDQVFADTNIHVGRIEQGDRDASYTTLCRLADYFDVGLDAFR